MEAQPKRQLSLFDSCCIVVGIIIGAGIYETAPMVAASMSSPILTVGVWVLGGLMAGVGALCYAELATAYPRQGGDYVYLTQAYGRSVGFLFGWSQLAVVRPGDITLMAFVFGRYAQELYQIRHGTVIYAALAIAVLTLINSVGVQQGKWTQNLLTTVKTLGLVAIIGVGLWGPHPDATPVATTTLPAWQGFQLALILVLFTYGGWNEMAYVAAEVKDPRRNIVRALILSTVTVTGLYVMINLSFLKSLGFAGMTSTEAVAVDVLATVLPEQAARLVAVLICISALGAVNGLIFTGARITYALGAEHRLFAWLGHWHERRGVPIRSLVAQALIALGIVLLASSFVDTILYGAPVFWLFLLLTGVSVWRLRKRRADVERPFRLPLYPLPVILFGLICLFMLYSSATYAWSQKPRAFMVLVAVMGLGLVLCILDARLPKKTIENEKVPEAFPGHPAPEGRDPTGNS